MPYEIAKLSSSFVLKNANGFLLKSLNTKFLHNAHPDNKLKMSLGNHNDDAAYTYQSFFELGYVKLKLLM